PIPDILNTDGIDDIIDRRLDFFSNSLSIARSELAAWCYTQCVLSACWSFDDNQEYSIWTGVANLFEADSDYNL
ncbi:MAG: hypothetical protein AAF153_00855, partial [Pseudomonadota bacterium]